MLEGRIAFLGDDASILPFPIPSFIESGAPEILLIEDKKLSPALLKRIHKLANIPVLVFVYGSKFKYWTYLQERKLPIPPLFWSQLEPVENLRSTIQQALQLFRNRKRLSALRNSQIEYAALGENPALQILSGFIRSISAATSFKDIKNALIALQSVVDYHELTYFEHKDISKSSAQLFPENVYLLRPDDPLGERFSSLAKSPWNSCIVVTIQSESTNSLGYFAFYRRDLIPLGEKDIWLLELAHGPLSLSMERIGILQKIEQASREWRATFDAISDPITVVDERYIIQKANTAFARLVKKDIKKIKGQKCFTLLTGKRQPCKNCPIIESSSMGNKILGRASAAVLAWSFHVEKDGHTQHFQFYRNLDKEAALKATLIQSEKLAALGRLVSAIAHEINNPLTGILATSQLLLADKALPNDSLREDISEIYQAAERSKKIVADLLGFTGANNNENSKIDVEECIRSAILFCKSALKNIELKEIYPNKKLYISGSVSQLQQVIFNLVTNAASAMQPSGGRLTIRLDASEVDHINISIGDTGPGLPPERIQNLFDPFHTTKKEGAGTGLGLSIIKNLVFKLGGSIKAKSEVGKGTEFSVILKALQ